MGYERRAPATQQSGQMIQVLFFGSLTSWAWWQGWEREPPQLGPVAAAAHQLQGTQWHTRLPGDSCEQPPDINPNYYKNEQTNPQNP